MKEYEITELMREYTDDEFGIEGENAADTEKVVESVMARVKAKKKVKPLFKVLIAAAAAVFVLGGTAAAIGIGLSQYSFTTNTNIHVKVDNDDKYVDMTNPKYPFKLVEGRIIFTADGGETDITDLIDEETPYIYPYTNTETGGQSYIIVGGTPDFPGYVDLFKFEGDPYWSGIGLNYLNPVEPKFPGIQWTEVDERGNEAHFGMFESEEQSFQYDKDCHMPWYVATWDMLGVTESRYEPNMGGMPNHDFSEEE